MAEEVPPSEATSGVTGPRDTETLIRMLNEEKDKAAVYLAGWQRAQADFVNYKRHCEQEKVEIGSVANSILICTFLPIFDDMERAFASIPPDIATHNWIEGIKLIERKWRSCLEAQGLATIKALGEPFDPRLHEAVRQVKGKEGIVVGEVEKGYKFHDRVIRPSKVVVGNGEE